MNIEKKIEFILSEANKKPKFKIGDKIKVTGISYDWIGKVSYIGDYDDLVNEYIYRITRISDDKKEDGEQKKWNESSLKKIK